MSITLKQSLDQSGFLSRLAKRGEATCCVWVSQGKQCGEPAAVITDTGDPEEGWCAEHFGCDDVDEMRAAEAEKARAK